MNIDKTVFALKKNVILILPNPYLHVYSTEKRQHLVQSSPD